MMTKSRLAVMREWEREREQDRTETHSSERQYLSAYNIYIQIEVYLQPRGEEPYNAVDCIVITLNCAQLLTCSLACSCCCTHHC